MQTDTAYSPVDILTTVSGTWSEAREHLRGLVGRGDVLVVDRTDDPQVRNLLDRMPGVVSVELPDASESEAIARALEAPHPSGVYYVAEPQPITRRAMAEAINTLWAERRDGRS